MKDNLGIPIEQKTTADNYLSLKWKFLPEIMNHPPESRDSMVSVSSIPVYLDHGQLHHRTMSQRQQASACRQNLNTLKPRQNGRHFPDATLKCIFLNENVWIFVTISLKFVPKDPINNIPALVQIMAWRHCLNHCWLVYWGIYASFYLKDLTLALPQDFTSSRRPFWIIIWSTMMTKHHWNPQKLAWK